MIEFTNLEVLDNYSTLTNLLAILASKYTD